MLATIHIKIEDDERLDRTKGFSCVFTLYLDFSIMFFLMVSWVLGVLKFDFYVLQITYHMDHLN